MQIGDILIYGGQRYLVCGFDPEGVSARLIYVENIVTGLRWALPFAETGLPEKFGGLRLVTETESDESGSDV